MDPGLTGGSAGTAKDKLGEALRATLKIGEARVRDLTHFSRLVH